MKARYCAFLKRTCLPVCLLLPILACGGDKAPQPTVTAGGTTVVVASFTAASASLTVGSETTLTAVFPNGTGLVDQGVGSILSGVPKTVRPTVDTTYTLTVSSASGTAQATTRITVLPAPDPVQPVITAPATVAPNQIGCVASVVDQPGMSFVWGITNGTITAGAGTRSITFTAGASGKVDLSCAAKNAAGTTSAAGLASCAIAVDAPTTAPAPTGAQTGENLQVTWGLRDVDGIEFGKVDLFTQAGQLFATQPNTAKVNPVTFPLVRRGSYYAIAYGKARNATTGLWQDVTSPASATIPVANHLPALPSPITLVTAKVGTVYSQILPAGSDLDGDPLSYTLTGLPTGLSFNGTTRTLAGIPTAAGNATLALGITDGQGGSVSTSLPLQTLAAGAVDAPTTNPVPEGRKSKSGVAVYWGLKDADGVEFGKVDLFNLAGQLCGTNPNEGKKATMTIDPVVRGSYYLVAYAKVKNGATGVWVDVTSARSATVAVANHPPELSVQVALVAAQVGVPYSHTLPEGSDSDHDALTYTLTNLPLGLTFNASTRVLAGTPTAVSTAAMVYSASDGQGGTIACTTSMPWDDAASMPVDVTAKVVNLGQAPGAWTPGPFARNPWDMIWFNNRLWIGLGNSDNEGSPNPNAGEIFITSWAPGETGFRREGAIGQNGATNGTNVLNKTIMEEQLDRFQILDGTLYFGGQDPRYAWDTRSTYRYDPAEQAWRVFISKDPFGKTGSNSLWGTHVYDLFRFGGRIFSSGYYYAVSDDLGVTWAPIGDVNSVFGRPWAFFTVNGKLFTQNQSGGGFSLFQYDGSKFAKSSVSSNRASVLPGLHITNVQDGDLKIVRPIAVGSATIFLAGLECSDHQSATTDVFLAKNLDPGAVDVRNTTPAGERPWDLLVRGAVGAEVAYLLTSRKLGTDAAPLFDLTIWKSNADFTGWTPLIRVKNQTAFARSFEEHNGDFWLGLGTDDGMNPSRGGAEYIEAWGGWATTMDSVARPEALYHTGVKEISGRILHVPRSAYQP